MSNADKTITALPLYDGKPKDIGPFPLDTVYMRDCIEAMREIPNNAVDLVIADPPYNASKGNNWKWDNSVKLPGFGGNWSKIMADWDNMSLAEYWAFTVAWLTEVKRIVRPTGSIWVHGTFHNIGIINFAMQMLDIEIINEVVWYKRNSFPNLSRRRLTASHETLLWAHSGDKKREYFFDYEAAKATGFNEDALKEPGKQLRTVWDIPNNKEKRELSHGRHPAQKPLRLLKRMMRISVKRGDVLLVPFAGSGSECVAAAELGIHFVGFDTDPAYLSIAKRRIEDVLSSQAHHQLFDAKSAYHIAHTNVASDSLRTGTIPALIKWTGSKRSQAHTILQYVPEHSRYLEPFVGGGALLYLAGRPGSVAGDIYQPLIDLWQAVQDNPQSVVDDYQQQWSSLQNDLPNYYYVTRDRFNESPNLFDLNFLIRTCVNGIIRFNSKGEFNNSFHLSRKGMMPERFAKAVQVWHEAIQGVKFVCQDYEKTLSDTKEGDFVYFDPPYAGNNMRYTCNLDFERFFKQLETLNQRDVKWALSFDGYRGNADLSWQVPEDLYRRKLLIPSGNSPIGKVLNGPIEQVHEALYLNY